MSAQTCADRVRFWWPSATNEAADHILWGTPFPFVSFDKIELELEDLRNKYGNDPGEVINAQYAEMDYQWRQYKESELYKEHQNAA